MEDSLQPSRLNYEFGVVVFVVVSSTLRCKVETAEQVADGFDFYRARKPGRSIDACGDRTSFVVLCVPRLVGVRTS